MRYQLRIDNKKTAARFEVARKACKLTQHELANKIGLNQSQVNRLLAGNFQRASKGFNALCAFLDVKPVMRDGFTSLAEYPELAMCLSEVLDGSRKRERALVRLVQSARTLVSEENKPS